MGVRVAYKSRLESRDLQKVWRTDPPPFMACEPPLYAV